MKVLQLNSVYEYGSTGRIVSDIHHTCLKQGIDSYVIFSRDGAIGKSKKTFTAFKNVFKISNPLEEKEHLIKGVLLDKHGLYSKKNTLNIISKIKEINPDIIHLHNIHGFYLNYEILFSFLKSFNKKVIWTLHDCWAVTSSCSHFEYSNNYQWKDGQIVDNSRNIYPYRVLNNNESNCIKKRNAFDIDNLMIVTPSKWLKNIIKNSFLKNKEIRIINNSINYDIFQPQYDTNFKKNHNLENKKILLGVSSLFTVQKGFNEYLKLSNLLDDKYVLVLIGLDNKQIRKLPQNIIGISRTENINELVGWYSNSDIFVNLTLEDTYPTVNLEAMACGLPVITYKTGGSSEIATVVVEKYDMTQLINAIKAMDLNKKVVKNEKNMTDEYLKLYEEAI